MSSTQVDCWRRLNTKLIHARGGSLIAKTIQSYLLAFKLRINDIAHYNIGCFKKVKTKNNNSMK